MALSKRVLEFHLVLQADIMCRISRQATFMRGTKSTTPNLAHPIITQKLKIPNPKPQTIDKKGFPQLQYPLCKNWNHTRAPLKKKLTKAGKKKPG